MKKPSLNKQRKEEIEREIRGYESEYLYPLAKELRIYKPKLNISYWTPRGSVRKISSCDIRPRTNLDNKVISMVGDEQVNIYPHVILETLSKQFEWFTIGKGMIASTAVYWLVYEYYKLYVLAHQHERFIGRMESEVIFDLELEKEAHQFANEFILSKFNSTVGKYISNYMVHDFFAKYFVNSPNQVSYYNAQKDKAASILNEVLKDIYKHTNII